MISICFWPDTDGDRTTPTIDQTNMISASPRLPQSTNQYLIAPTLPNQSADLVNDVVFAATACGCFYNLDPQKCMLKGASFIDSVLHAGVNAHILAFCFAAAPSGHHTQLVDE